MIIIEPYGSHLKPKYDFSFWALFGLLFSHIITALNWYSSSAWNLYLENNFSSYCTPLLKNCTDYAFTDVSFLEPFFLLYAIVSGVGLALLLFKKKNISEYIFYGLFVFKLLILISRLNFVNSYQEIHLILCLVYIISRGAQLPYRLVFCFQYFLSGIAKLSLSWVSGATLLSLYEYSSQSILYPIGLSYVVALKVVLVWGLLINSRFIRQCTVLQLVVFHSCMYFFIGGYYSLATLGFLIPIIISDFYKESGSIFKEFFELNILRQGIFAVFCLFLIFGKNFFQEKQSSFIASGENKFIDINVAEGSSKCRFRLIEVLNDGNIIERDISDIKNCKQAAYKSYLKRFCEKEKNKNFLLHVEKKEEEDSFFKEIERQSNVCKNL